MPTLENKTHVIENKAIFEKYAYFKSGVSSCAMYSYCKSPINPVCYYNYKKRHFSKTLEIHPRILDYCTIYIAYEGNYGFIFDNIAYHLTPGDVFIIKNNVEFSSFFSENSYIDCYEITFPMDFFEHFNNDSIFHRMFFENTKKGIKNISLNSTAAKSVLQKFNKIDELINSKSDNVDILSFSYIVQILGIIDSQMNLENVVIEAIKIPNKLKKAVNYIHENFTDPITIDDISNHCNITNTYLARIFKNVYMTTPSNYLTRLRISYAKQLLAKGKSLADTCYSAGFNDYNHFITKFKNFTSITPSKYQKSKIDELDKPKTS